LTAFETNGSDSRKTVLFGVVVFSIGGSYPKILDN
jgi:hypothetical protein